MAHLFGFSTLFAQIRSQSEGFWRSSLYGIAATLLLLPVPMLIPLLVDEILLDHPGSFTKIMSDLGISAPWLLVAAVATVIIGLRALAFLANNRKAYHAARITERVAYLLRSRILRHLERVALREYETLKPGGIASKMTHDVSVISGFVGSLTATLLGATVMLTGIAAVMLWMNWILAVMVFVLNPFFLAFSRILGRKSGELLRRQHESHMRFNELLNETLELFIQVRASNQEHSFFSLLDRRAKAVEEHSLAYGHKSAAISNSSTLLTNTVVDIFRAGAVIAVAYSDLSIGMMLAFLFYLSTLVSPTQQLMGLVVSYQSAKPAIERINALLSLSREPDYPARHNPFVDKPTTSVTLQHVSFGYQSDREILHDITLSANGGETIALIGQSGSGKSTIAQLMVGFYPPESGTILYGDAPFEQIGLSTIRDNVALMLQESLFFNDTLRMNLSLTATHSDEALYDALSIAQLESFVRDLPEGLESRIGKNGIRLSGGQRQRLAIARLILSDPRIVILDEATSALDSATEYRLYQALSPFLASRTTIIIAHRTTTIRQADHIYLIKDGRVTAHGKYHRLKEQGVIREDYDMR